MGGIFWSLAPEPAGTGWGSEPGGLGGGGVDMAEEEDDVVLHVMGIVSVG